MAPDALAAPCPPWIFDQAPSDRENSRLPWKYFNGEKSLISSSVDSNGCGRNPPGICAIANRASNAGCFDCKGIRTHGCQRAHRYFYCDWGKDPGIHPQWNYAIANRARLINPHYSRYSSSVSSSNVKSSAKRPQLMARSNCLSARSWKSGRNLSTKYSFATR